MRRLLPLMVLAASLLPQCNSDVLAPDETEVRVRNALDSIPLSVGDTVKYVDLYGVRVGGVACGDVAHGATTGYRVSSEYGNNVTLSVDSLAIWIEICGTFCADVSYILRDVPVAHVSVDRNAKNTVTIDESVIDIDNLFGTTRVQVQNLLLDVTLTVDSSVISYDSLHLYGVSIDDTAARFDEVRAGVLSPYDTLAPRSGTVTVRIDSVVGVDRYLTQRMVTVWDSVSSVQRTIQRYMANTLTFSGSSSDLLSHLGPGRLR